MELTGVSSNVRIDFLVVRPQSKRSAVAARPQRQVQTRLTDAEVARLITVYQAAAKIKQLATDFGINRNTVSSILRISGVAPRRRGSLLTTLQRRHRCFGGLVLSSVETCWVVPRRRCGRP